MQELTISLGQNGRVVIPASVRKSLGLRQGHVLRLYMEDEKIVLEKTDDVVRKLQERFSTIKESLADELIKERRKSATKE